MSAFDRVIELKNGKKVRLWSDNVDEETMHVYDADEEFDAESTICDIVKYAEVKEQYLNIE